MEGPASDCRTESEGLPKGGDAEQAGDAGGGRPVRERHPELPYWDILIRPASLA